MSLHGSGASQPATIVKMKMASASASVFVAVLTISALLLVLVLVNPVRCTDDDDDIIAFLSQDDVDDVHPHLPPQFTPAEEEDTDLSDLPPQFNPPEQNENEDDVAMFDDSHVVVLTDANFSSFITKNQHVMVEFYAPWCGHCKTLAPEYAAAAKDLAVAEEGAEVALAKVDATEESDLSQKYDIQGFPTLLFFIDGVRLDYSGGRSRDTIVEWIKKKIGPGVHNITTVEEAEHILTSQHKIVLGYLHSLLGADSDELSAASKLEDQVNFYQTVNADVAKLFHIDPKAKRPALVLLKKEEEKVTYFDGELSTSRMAEFVAANKLPLVTTFTQESAQSLFDNAIKKQVLLFTLSNETSDVLPVFQEAAKSFKGKIIFVSVEKDNEEIGEPVCAYFGVTGEGPQVIAFSGNEDQKKYFLKGELTVDNIKKFAEDFLEDRLQPFFKSDPIPDTNDGDVKIVVGNNFDEIVLDESKDVLLEIYAPWCGHCEALEPIYNKLGKHLRDIDSLVIAKMDGTSNEHPRAQQDGFPTILFFPAGNKSFEPIVYDGERTVVEFYKFLKKHASIPFKLKKQHTSPSVTKSEASATESKKADKDSKDEL